MIVKMISVTVSRIFKFTSVSFVAGFILALILFGDWGKLKITASEIRLGSGRFTNPLLECELGEVLSQDLVPFRPEIEKIISKLKKQGKIFLASYYFRDLNNGPWIGINEKDLFFPSSLLKMPMMMGALKYVQTNPNFLKKSLVYRGEDLVADQFYKPKNRVSSGETHSVAELIERAIIYSDNNAAILLSGNLPVNVLYDPYVEVGLNLPTNDNEGIMSVKSYGSFFRLLFNASYLSREFSEVALSILSRSTFSDGIRKSLPENIVVASKFGERLNGEEKQLHDCGIVYYPGRPYLICIMTKGNDFNKLSEAIAELSLETYKQVDARVKSNF